ncbi:MAG TPA: hypothetical protein VME22_03675 [Solirubrobacteraceae bacterium]|nr:hypothetical protein [Solirubrobacteraceae bacterium]
MSQVLGLSTADSHPAIVAPSIPTGGGSSGTTDHSQPGGLVAVAAVE